MFWLQMMVLAQTLECPLEPELRLSPARDEQVLSLRRTGASKSMEAWRGDWRGVAVELSMRRKDGAVGLKLGGANVPLRPTGVTGVEGTSKVAYGQHGFSHAPVAFRVLKSEMGYGASVAKVHLAATVMVAAKCRGRLLLVRPDGLPPAGLDENGDGRVDPGSPAEFRRTPQPVWNLMGQGVRIVRIDWPRRVVLMEPTDVGPQFEENEVVPDYLYTDRLKEQRQFSNHGQSWTLVNYWVSACAPCVAAFPQLKLLAESYDLRITGINADTDPAEASRVLAQFEVLWPDIQATDPPALYDYRFRVASYPAYILLDSKRRVILRTENTAELLEFIRRMVPRKP